MAQLFDFGLVGLGVMGRNFLLNVSDHHFSSIGLDTDAQKVADLKTGGGVSRVRNGKSEVLASTDRCLLEVLVRRGRYWSVYCLTNSAYKNR